MIDIRTFISENNYPRKYSSNIKIKMIDEKTCKN